MISPDSKLVVLSGSPSALKQQIENDTPATIQIVPSDEKAVADVRAMMRLMRSTYSDLLCFGCKALDLQRYQFALKTFLLLGKARQRLIVDESGQRHVVTWSRYLFVDIPHLAWEMVASVGELLFAFIRLELMRQTVHERRGRRP